MISPHLRIRATKKLCTKLKIKMSQIFLLHTALTTTFTNLWHNLFCLSGHQCFSKYYLLSIDIKVLSLANCYSSYMKLRIKNSLGQSVSGWAETIFGGNSADHC